MQNSTNNRSALAAWKRQPLVNELISERDKLQKQLDEVLAGAYSKEAETEAESLYGQIAVLNKKIGTKASRVSPTKKEREAE